MTKLTIEITDDNGVVEQSVLMGDKKNFMTATELTNMFGYAMLALSYCRETVSEVLNTDEFYVENGND